jgi:hypothetical protein
MLVDLKPELSQLEKGGDTMPYILGIIKVEDFAKWKSEFDSEDDKALRKDGGMKSYQLFHIEDAPNNLVLLCEFDNLSTGRKFGQSEELREANQQSGVIGQPELYFLEEIEKRSV